MKNLVIGIEGLVGSGKTSICRELLNRIPNSILLNGSNLYRAIVQATISSGRNIDHISDFTNIDIKTVMDLFRIEIKIENRETAIYMNGLKVDEESLQSKETSLAVSQIGKIADNSKLFIFAKKLIEELKTNYCVIISGRAIMRIYPQLDCHLFITADLEERIKRKSMQYQASYSYDEIRQNIITRDELQKEAGFYDLSPQTIVVDVTDCDTIEKSTSKVLEHINRKQNII